MVLFSNIYKSDNNYDIMGREKFLDKFLIDDESNINIQRILHLKDEKEMYRTDLSILTYPTEIQISSAMNHEGFDEHTVPRLRFMGDLYNTIYDYFVKKDAIKRMTSDNVLHPRFHLDVTHQETIKDISYENDPSIFLADYTRLIEMLNTIYDVHEVGVEKDWIHDEKAVLTPFEHYGIELTKPSNSHFVNFSVTADEHADYSRLEEISTTVRKAAEECLSDLITFYDNDPMIGCHFWVNIDIKPTGLLTAPIVQGYLESKTSLNSE